MPYEKKCSGENIFRSSSPGIILKSNFVLQLIRQLPFLTQGFWQFFRRFLSALSFGQQDPTRPQQTGIF